MTAPDRRPGPSGPERVGADGSRFEAWVGRPTGERWVPAAALLGPGLAGAVDEVAALRGTTVPVAGALLFENYAQRLVPPVLAAWYEQGRVLDCGLDDVVVEWSGARVVGVAVATAVSAPPGREPVGPDLLMTANLAPAIEAVHDATGVGRRVLRGAVAHAVSVAFLHLSWPKPDPAHDLPRLRQVLERWGIADLVHSEAAPVGERRWLYAERRSCCLAFRAADHRGATVRFCATCPVVPEDERRRSFTEAVSAFTRRTTRP